MIKKRVKNTVFKQIARLLFGLFVFLYLISPLKAQRAVEIGAHLGTSYYMGDLNWSKHFYKTNLNYGAFYKQHLNKRIILKFGAFYSHLEASDKDSKYLYQKLRDHDFYTSMVELSAQTEFNFLIYEIGETEKNFYTPYLNLGFSVSHTPESEKKISTALPMAFGFKVNVSRRLILGAEWAFRKSFCDMLDNTTGEDLDFYETTNVPIDNATFLKQNGFKFNKDWYSYAALSLSYALSIGDNKCYAYY